MDLGSPPTFSVPLQVFHTFVVSFSEQRRPIIPLLTAMRRSPQPSQEQRALREAWDALTDKVGLLPPHPGLQRSPQSHLPVCPQLREYRTELDTSLPPPLDTVAGWLLKTEGVLAEEEEAEEAEDHGPAADEAKEKQQLLKVSFFFSLSRPDGNSLPGCP